MKRALVAIFFGLAGILGAGASQASVPQAAVTYRTAANAAVLPQAAVGHHDSCGHGYGGRGIGCRHGCYYRGFDTRYGCRRPGTVRSGRRW